jgi:diguanylate cyclase (GGDEF)-like protein
MGTSSDEPDRRKKKRRRSDRWRARLLPVWYGLLIDAALITALLVAQRRTARAVRVILMRLKSEAEVPFPPARFLGNGNLEDFEMLAGELRQLKQAATIDFLTGLPNPASIQSDLLAYARVASSEGDWLAACVIDVDHFKDVNETYGHDAANQVLSELAGRLRAAIAPPARIGRWGGDEFVLLCPDADVVGASVVAEAVRSAVDDAPFRVGEGANEIQVSVTIGVAAGRAEGLDGGRLFHAADEDLREAKRVGRNRIGVGRTLLSADRDDPPATTTARR